ncbi:MAG: hypothetical protein MHPDNHAH_01865 [Anaerolineales bacterium]|nr:hypothetical protein [Anaerolineales bacterium]
MFCNSFRVADIQKRDQVLIRRKAEKFFHFHILCPFAGAPLYGKPFRLRCKQNILTSRGNRGNIFDLQYFWLGRSVYADSDDERRTASQRAGFLQPFRWQIRLTVRERSGEHVP